MCKGPGKVENTVRRNTRMKARVTREEGGWGSRQGCLCRVSDAMVRGSAFFLKATGSL